MAKLKNWTVTVEPIINSMDGLISYFHYLQNGDAESHEETNIYNLSNTRAALLNIINEYENRISKRKKDKKAGGRPVGSLAQSFVLSLPNEIKPTAEQWKKIGIDVIKAVALHNDLDPKELYKITAFVLHEEPSKNSHLNLCFGKVLNGEVLKNLQKPNTTKAIKEAFNTAVLKHHKTALSDYTPKNTNVGKKSRWQHFKELLEQAMKLVMGYRNAKTVEMAADKKANAILTAEKLPELEMLEVKTSIEIAQKEIILEKGSEFSEAVNKKALAYIEKKMSEQKQEKEQKQAKNKIAEPGQQRKRRRRTK